VCWLPGRADQSTEDCSVPITDPPFIHALARVEDGVAVGSGTKVWAGAHLRAGARIGAECVIGSDVTVDPDVVVGDRCKIQNAALLYRGVSLGNGVFIGPGAILTNDRRPRAVAPDGALLADGDWAIAGIVVEDGASIGANATVVAGTRIGAWSMVGAGAVVTHDVGPHELVVGVPARRVGAVCMCGHTTDAAGEITCAACGRRFTVATP
jgi:acetyltransferase-like isoleucine patch superfamily enzyme